MSADLEGDSMPGRFTICVAPGELAEVLSVESISHMVGMRKPYGAVRGSLPNVNGAGSENAPLAR